MAKISAVMPVYNRERYLASAIESVLSQSYGDLELLIVDDGSSDASVSIARRYQAAYPDKVRLIEQPNQGPSKARNAAIKRATGELVAFIDSDDLWEPDKLELQVKVLQENSNTSFVYTGYLVIDEVGKVSRESLPDSRMQGWIHRKLWTVENDISGGTLLVPSKHLACIGGFDETLKGAENLDLRIRLSRLGEVRFVEKCLYRYRRHGSNLTNHHDPMNEAYRRLIDKHFGGVAENIDRSLARRVVSSYHHRLGVQQFSEMNLGRAIPCFATAIFHNPLKVDPYVRLFRCCLGRRANGVLAKLRQAPRA